MSANQQRSRLKLKPNQDDNDNVKSDLTWAQARWEEKRAENMNTHQARMKALHEKRTENMNNAFYEKHTEIMNIHQAELKALGEEYRARRKTLHEEYRARMEALGEKRT